MPSLLEESQTHHDQHPADWLRTEMIAMRLSFTWFGTGKTLSAEQAFLDELAKLVDHLSERLTGQQDGRPKVFRDSAVANLTEFFERFRHLSVRSNEQLDELVERAHQVVRGVQPQQLRDSGSLRQHVSTQLSGVQSALDGLLVDRPRRNILRRPR